MSRGFYPITQSAFKRYGLLFGFQLRVYTKYGFPPRQDSCRVS